MTSTKNFSDCISKEFDKFEINYNVLPYVLQYDCLSPMYVNALSCRSHSNGR